MFGADRERMGMRGVIIAFIENDGNIHPSHVWVVYVVMTVDVDGVRHDRHKRTS